MAIKQHDELTTSQSVQEQMQVYSKVVSNNSQIAQTQQEVARVSGAQAGERFKQATNTLLTSNDQTQRNAAAKTLAETMRNAGFDTPKIIETVKFVDATGSALGYLIQIQQFDRAQKLADDVGNGRINSSDQVLKQMETWGYHDFVLQEQNVLAQYAALVLMLTAIITQNMKNHPEQPRNQIEEDRLRKEQLEKDLERMGIEPGKIKEVADKVSKEVKDGEDIGYVMASIIAAKDVWTTDPATILPATYDFVSSKRDGKKAALVKLLHPNVQAGMDRANELQVSKDDLHSPKLYAAYSSLAPSVYTSNLGNIVPVKLDHGGKIENLRPRDQTNLFTYSPVRQGLSLETYRLAYEKYRENREV